MRRVARARIDNPLPLGEILPVNELAHSKMSEHEPLMHIGSGFRVHEQSERRKALRQLLFLLSLRARLLYDFLRVRSKENVMLLMHIDDPRSPERHSLPGCSSLGSTPRTLAARPET